LASFGIWYFAEKPATRVKRIGTHISVQSLFRLGSTLHPSLPIPCSCEPHRSCAG
jgi:hypothetical protein